jgi:PAS domain S-box-containing protein
MKKNHDNFKVGRIMIVDDEAELMTALCEALAGQGYETTGFTTGADALKILVEQDYDLLLTDLMMPEMDGIALLQAGLEIDPNLVGIIMTGHGTVQTAVEAMKKGAFDYVLKPFKLNSLLPLLSRAMEVRSLRMENIQLRETVAIHELGKAIAFSTNLNAILNKVADATLQQCNADEVSIMLPTRDGQELYIAVARGGHKEYIGERVPMERGIAGWVATHRETVVINGNVDDQRFSPIHPRNDINAAVSMPMLSGGNLVGVLNVNVTKSHRHMTLGQVKALSILVSIISPILENTWLNIQIRQAEEKYRSLLDNASDAIFLANMEGNLQEANKKAEEILGYSREEISGIHISRIHPAEVFGKIKDIFNEIITKGSGYVNDVSVLRKDGKIIPVDITGSLIERDGTKVLQGIFRDITERKRTVEVLREDKERYRTLVENASDIVFRTDNSGNFTFVNPAGIRITGYEKEEMMGKHYPTLIHPDMRDEAMKFFGRQFVKGIQNTYLEYPLLTKEGHKLWFGQNTQLIFEDDHVVGFQAVARDITDRKQAEESLREQEIKLSSIFRAAPVGIGMVINRVFQEANEMLCHMTGYNRKELLGKSARMLYPTQEDYDYVGQEKYRQISEKGTGTVETRWKRKDGTVIDIILSSTRLDPDNLAKGVTFTALDITDRKQAGEELREALVSLRKAFGATIQVLVSAVEIRDPCTSGHQIRSAGLARAIATEMGFTKERIDGIRMAGSIHDIGKLSIPAEILSKPTKLTNIEFSLIKEHSQSGYEMLKDVESPWPLAEIVYQHHERMDGSGYPRNLKGDDILMEARIMAVADVVESMASHRPYRPALGIDKALEEIEKNKGTLYDNAVADTCLRLFREKGFQL